MKILTVISFTVTIASATAQSVQVLDESVYKSSGLLYTADNDIVDIHVFMSDVVFITERKLANGKFEGIHAIFSGGRNKPVKKEKMLDNGKCTTSHLRSLYFGASDGIYTLNMKKDQVERYGNIKADITAIQRDSSQDLLYIVTNRELHKVTESGTIMQRVELVNNVQEVVLDKDNNVYIYEILNINAKLFTDIYSTPKVKVIVGDTVTEIKGLPDKYEQIKLARGLGTSEGALLVLDKRIYRIFANGTSVATEFMFENAPTAFLFDLGIVQLFGHDKKLYQWNIVDDMKNELPSVAGEFYLSIFHEIKLFS